MMNQLSVEEKYRRGCRVILFIIVCITLLSWIYLIRNTSTAQGMSMDMGGAAATMEAYDLVKALTSAIVPDFGMFVPMWFVMCIAMMLPTAIPMVLAIHRICVEKEPLETGKDRILYLPVLSFVISYCLLWLAFGIICWLAAFVGFHFLQGWLQNWRHLWLAVSVLIFVCGVYQVSPLKNACLTGCQHPIMFITRHWKPGSIGAFQMGLRHGAECIGCCAALMIVMLPLGMMNLVWMGLFTLLMFVEKNGKYGTAIGKIAGWTILAAGAISTLVAVGFFVIF